MFKSSNRGISTIVGLIIIIVVAVLATGGILVWQKGWIGKTPTLTSMKTTQPTITPTVITTPKPTAQTQTPQDETANWKTYTNKDYKYEVKYPLDWKMREEMSTEAMSTIWWDSPQTAPITPEKRFIQVGAMNYLEGYSFSQMLPALSPGAKGCENVKMGSIEFCKIEEKFATVQSIVYAVSQNNKIYFLKLYIGGGRQKGGYYLPESEIQNELNIFNQMLPTFKFLY